MRSLPDSNAALSRALVPWQNEIDLRGLSVHTIQMLCDLILKREHRKQSKRQSLDIFLHDWLLNDMPD